MAQRSSTSECRADESGLTGSARFTKGILETHYSKETQLAISQVEIPENPPPNWSAEGTLDHIGDNYRVVANEQIIEGNVITVRAAHMYLLGPIAVGESIVGQVTCGLSAAKISTAPPVTVAKTRNSATTVADGVVTPRPPGPGASLVGQSRVRFRPIHRRVVTIQRF